MTMKDLLQIAFPLLMILFPALFMTAVSFNRRANVNPQLASRLMFLLWIATVFSVGIWLALYALVSARLAQHAWVLFFPLWFGFHVQLMRAKNPDWVSTPPPDMPVRSASVAVRSQRPMAPAWAIWSMWGLWMAGCILVIVLVDFSVLMSSAPELHSRRLMGWTALSTVACLVFLPAMTTLLLPAINREPAPLDPAASTELQSLYELRRRQRAWIFIALTWSMVAVFTALSGGMALVSRGVWPEAEANTVLGWAGGIAGSIIGISGAIFGVLSNMQAARINARLRELSQAG